MPGKQFPEDSVKQPFWNRPFTRRQALITCFLVGFVAALAMMVLGDYQLKHRLPSFADAVLYVALALVFGPVFVFGATLKSRSLKRLLFQQDPKDR